MKKKLSILSLLLVLTMTVMGQTLVDGIYYYLNTSENTAWVTNENYGYLHGGYTGDVVIPTNISVYGIDYSVTSIEDYAFRLCSGLTTIEIPNSVTSIGKGAFRGCSGLTTIEIPQSVTSIGEGAFEGCSGLISLVVAADNPAYDSRENCNAIIETANNTLIGGCKNTIIPNSVTSIEDYAFRDCSSLTNIEIPNSITSIGNYAFRGCSGLTSIVVAADNPAYDSRENCNAIIETTNNTLIQGCQNTIIPSSVTSIGDWAFYKCSELTNIEIPNSITLTGAYAFAYCTGLTNIEIPNSVTSIGHGVFRGCSGLTTIEIPNSVTSIKDEAFFDCTCLTSLTMQAATPPTTSSSAFHYCDKLKFIYVPTGAKEAYNVAPWNQYNIVESAPEIPDDAPNYEPRHNGTKTRWNRPVTAVKLIGESSGEQIYSLTSTEQSQDFTDVTASVVFKVYAGETLTPVVEHDATWMNHAVYIDTDKNGFTGAIEAGSEWKPAGDLVSYSFYNNGADDDTFGWNSVGEDISGDNRDNPPLPAFTAPTQPGIYRMRFVQDWCSIDPAGDNDGKYGDFKDNGGQIVDVMLEVLDNVYLTDGEDYINSTERETERITYTRNFNNTQWQAWYVPFDIDYDAISDDFTAASLNAVHQYDDDEDGVFERWTLEILKLKSGEVLRANMPYMIRAKETGEHNFVVENAILYPAEENSLDCSSVRVLYTFKGNYSLMDGQVLRDNGWFAPGGGSLVTPTVGSNLKAYRWLLMPEARSGYGTFYAPKRINIVIGDEEGEVTGIEEVTQEEWPADVYDLNGRMVKAQAENLDELPKGVYIVNGKKFVK